MRYRVEVARYVALDHPLVTLTTTAYESVTQVGDDIIGASIWPESIRVLTKVCFPYWFEDHPQGFLYNPIAYAGNTKWSFLPVGFGDVHPSDWLWFKDFGFE